MKPKNNSTIINCAEDLYKILFIAVEEKIYISNLIPPTIIENLMEISSENLKIIYFDINELESENKVKLIKNGTVKYKLNKKNHNLQAKIQIPIKKQNNLQNNNDTKLYQKILQLHHPITTIRIILQQNNIFIIWPKSRKIQRRQQCPNIKTKHILTRKTTHQHIHCRKRKRNTKTNQKIKHKSKRILQL